jgi:hypothetical protein
MPKGVLLYSYMPSLAPAVSYRMLVKRGGAQSAILIELSDEMADLLREYAAIARQTYPETEE